MARVLTLATFRVKPEHREAFLEAARAELKPYWEAHGVERFEVYAEIGPTGPTGRVTQVCHFPSREAYLALQAHQDPAAPVAPYRWLSEPQFQVLEARA
jgi:quinol monooxygenase YgiN